MQILVAYRVDSGGDPTNSVYTAKGVVDESGQTSDASAWTYADGVRRVSALDRWVSPPRLQQRHGPASGVVLWEAASTPSRWPAWVEHGDGSVVASLYAPLGHRRVTGDAPLQTAPLVLADALMADPTSMGMLTPPFVLTRRGPDGELDLFTDALGVGRLFELVTPWGRVWSNRGDAALRFAGMPARADRAGWTHAAVADEFFGESGPYEGVRVLDAATHVRVRADGRTVVHTADVVAQWAAEARTDPAVQERLVAYAAEGLRAAASSVGELYEAVPTVDLSGGRDSRVVAAAFLTSGAPMRLHSHDAFAPDLATALELVDMLHRREPGTETVHQARNLDGLEHHVRHIATGGAVEPRPLRALGAARRWHIHADGLRPCTFIAHSVPEGLDVTGGVAVGGVGGEVAHAVYYPSGYPALDKLPASERLDRYAANVLSRVAPVAGASVASRSELLAHVRARLGEIHVRGFTDARALDVFYARERMRRWGTTGERLGVVSPLLSPAFTAAALALTPEQRTRSDLHRNVVRELIPAWADVPFFAAEKHLLDDPSEDRVLADVQAQGEAVARAAARVRARLDTAAHVAVGASARDVAGGAAPSPAGRPEPASPAKPTARILRLADAEDAADVADVIAAGEAGEAAWAGVMDVPTVQRYWHESVAGTTTVRQERVLRQVVWRTAFEDHVADLDGRRRPRYPRRAPEVAATAPSGLGVMLPPTASTEVSAGIKDAVSAPAPVPGLVSESISGLVPSGRHSAKPGSGLRVRGTLVAVRRNRLVRKLARGRVWQTVRTRKAGVVLRRVVRRAVGW